MSVVLEFKQSKPKAAVAPAPKTSGKRTWRHPTKEYVRAEAEYDMALDGSPNVYTSYLKLHGVYPGPKVATAMGLRLGKRVRADDGLFYPPKTKAEKKHDAERRSRRKEEARVAGGAISLHYALQSLARNGATDDEIIAWVTAGKSLGEAPVIERDLEAAMTRLQRFAAAWRARHPVKQDLVPPR